MLMRALRQKHEFVWQRRMPLARAVWRAEVRP